MSAAQTRDTHLADVLQRLRRQEDLTDIRNVLAAYCRGIDRRDERTLREIYHDDAIEDRGSGLFIGRAHDWIPWTLNLLPVFAVTQHCIFNSIIDLEGDTAHGETYFRAYHRFGKVHRQDVEASVGEALTKDVEWPEGDVELLLAGRYLDRFERRDGVWRFSYRKMVNDWVHARPIADGWFTENPTAYRSVPTIDDARLGSKLHELHR